MCISYVIHVENSSLIDRNDYHMKSTNHDGGDDDSDDNNDAIDVDSNDDGDGNANDGITINNERTVLRIIRRWHRADDGDDDNDDTIRSIRSQLFIQKPRNTRLIVAKPMNNRLFFGRFIIPCK